MRAKSNSDRRTGPEAVVGGHDYPEPKQLDGLVEALR
jgi:hypothetical protein